MNKSGTVLKRLGVLLLTWLIAAGGMVTGAPRLFARAEDAASQAGTQYEAAQALFDAQE